MQAGGKGDSWPHLGSVQGTPCSLLASVVGLAAYGPNIWSFGSDGRVRSTSWRDGQTASGESDLRHPFLLIVFQPHSTPQDRWQARERFLGTAEHLRSPTCKSSSSSIGSRRLIPRSTNADMPAEAGAGAKTCGVVLTLSDPSAKAGA
jgi:hypothetical protein